MKAWKRVEPTTAHKVGWRTVVTKTFIDSKKQSHIFDTYCKEGQEFVAILALTAENQAIVVRQFRMGPEKIMDELPGGFVDPGENKENAVRRELLEETGYEAGLLEYIGAYHKDAYMNAVWHVFFATGCVLKRKQLPSVDEEVELALISIEQLFDNARHDRMTDAVAVYWAADKFRAIMESK